MGDNSLQWPLCVTIKWSPDGGRRCHDRRDVPRLCRSCLVPTLRRNDIVVMDNCRVHLGLGVGAYRNGGRRHCVTCRNIRPTSIPSRCLTANRRHSCVKWQREPSRANRAIRSLIPQLHPQECRLPSSCRLCFNMIEIRFSIVDWHVSQQVLTPLMFSLVQHWILRQATISAMELKHLDGVASLVLRRRRGVRAFPDARRCERPCAYFQSVSAVADKSLVQNADNRVNFRSREKHFVCGSRLFRSNLPTSHRRPR